jgi:hypothetical protein
MKKIFLGLGMLALALGIFASFTDKVDAYRGDPTVKGPNYSEERHTLMQKAFETNDYNAWKNLMQNRGRATQVINENNFSKFSEAHKLALSGDLEGAQKIRQELGLGLKNGSGQGMHRANRGLNFNR